MGLKISTVKGCEPRWFPWCGAELRIQAYNSTEHKIAYAELMRAKAAEVRGGELSVAQDLELELRAMARAILVDWRDILDDEGNEIPYSAERSFEFLSESAALKEFVEQVSRRLILFTTQAVHDAEEALKKSSDGA